MCYSNMKKIMLFLYYDTNSEDDDVSRYGRQNRNSVVFVRY